FADDVAAADEFALNVKLRDGRPLGIGLDALTQLVVLEHVKTLIGHAEIIEDLHDLAGEAAHRKLRRALHEQHHLVSLDLVVDELIDRHSCLPCWAAGKTLPRRIPSARRAIYVAQNGCKAHAADFMALRPPGRRRTGLSENAQPFGSGGLSAPALRFAAPRRAACPPFRP